MTVDQFEKLDQKMDHVIAEAGEMRTEQALSRQELGQIRQHLVTLNGRTARSEERITTMETLAAEARGAWKLAVLAASIPATIIAAIAAWLTQHGGK